MHARCGLLLVSFDDLRRPDMCLIRVAPCFAEGAPLAQEVPALIQFNIHCLQPFTVRITQSTFPVKAMLFRNELLNVVQDRLLCRLVFHKICSLVNYQLTSCDRDRYRPLGCGITFFAGIGGGVWITCWV